MYRWLCTTTTRTGTGAGTGTSGSGGGAIRVRRETHGAARRPRAIRDATERQTGQRQRLEARKLSREVRERYIVSYSFSCPCTYTIIQTTRSVVVRSHVPCADRIEEAGAAGAVQLTTDGANRPARFVSQRQPFLCTISAASSLRTRYLQCTTRRLSDTLHVTGTP